MRPVHGYSEAYYRLLKSLGILASQSHALGISKEDFGTNCFALASDLEKVSSVMSSGANVQGIDLRVSGTGLADGQGQANSGVSRVYFITHYQAFIELRAGTVTLLT